MTSKMGRPTTLTPELQAALVESRRGPLPDRDVCLKNGVSVNTVKSWLQRGLKEDATEPYLSFAEEWEQAKIERKEFLLQRIDDFSADCKGADYKGAAWALERMAPKQFGSKALEQGHQDGEIDLDELMRDDDAEATNLDSLLLNPPTALLEAFRRNGDAVRALLDELEQERAARLTAGP